MVEADIEATVSSVSILSIAKFKPGDGVRSLTSARRLIEDEIVIRMHFDPKETGKESWRVRRLSDLQKNEVA